MQARQSNRSTKRKLAAAHTSAGPRSVGKTEKGDQPRVSENVLARKALWRAPSVVVKAAGPPMAVT